MRTHPYLRAYMAGIVVPTVIMLLAPIVFMLTGAPPLNDRTFSIASLLQLAIFPGAVVPNLWGIWNLLHLRLRDRLRIPHAVFGALIPLVLLPLVKAVLPNLFGLHDVLIVLPVAIAGYYLVWKFAVGFLNQEMGIG